MTADRQEYQSDVAAALDGATPLVEVLTRATDPQHIIPLVRDNATVREVLNLEQYLERPRRPRGTVKALDAEGFTLAVANLRNDEDASVVYVDSDACRLVCVVNDDFAGLAAWRDHRIELDLRPTPEWLLWTNGQGLGTQEKFATTIEEGEAEIQVPNPTVMLELAQTFHASVSSSFKQAGRLTDGRTQFAYEEDIDGKAGDGGTLAIPAEFTLGLRPFFGAARYEVKARLRYRLARGELSIGYFLHRPDDVRRIAFENVVGHISDKTADLPFVHGVPASPTSAAT